MIQNETMPLLGMEQALWYLKNQYVLMSNVDGKRTMFVMREHLVRISNQGSNYSLTEHDFMMLFQAETFQMVVPVMEDPEISLRKDNEYYGWKHK